MVVLLITCFTPRGLYRECCLTGQTLESCLEKLSELVRSDWRLLTVKVTDDSSSSWLPIKAIDGQPIATTMQLLQREWEACLQS